VVDCLTLLVSEMLLFMKVILSRLTRLINFFLIPKEWRPPKKCDIVIYDDCGSDILIPYLIKYQIEVFCSRNERLNVVCLLASILNSQTWKGNFYQGYLEAFIRAASPKLVITYIDNDSRFYQLSYRIKTIKTIFVQNGFRGLSGDLDRLTRLHHNKVDYMLVHGPAIGAYYSKINAGKIVNIGSFKNNMFKVCAQSACNDVLFVSQWRQNIARDNVMYLERDGTPVYWDQFYSAEYAVLKLLSVWCLGQGKILHICGCALEANAGEELKFYDSILSNCCCKWFYHKRMDAFSSYRLVDTSEIVVTIDSTLGYESLSRGKKTAFFCCRESTTSNSLMPSFGWPASMPIDGPFWTNSLDRVRFAQILDYLGSVAIKDWDLIVRYYATEIIDYDLGNSRFVSLVEELIRE